MRNTADYVAHIGMDAFFASVEQAANPMLRNSAIMVTGKGPRHGVVTSASYEAKRKGVRAGMSSYEALKLCPEAIAVEVDGRKYEAFSKEVMKLVSEVSPRIAVASIDEAYIDLSVYRDLKACMDKMKELKTRIRKKLGLPSSVGIGVNPIIAKTASDFDKPDGFVVVKAGYEKLFFEEVPVGDVPGIGPHTACYATSLGYKKASDLVCENAFAIYKNFGNSFLGLVKSLTALDFSREAFFREELPKSFGNSMTFTKEGFEARGISVFLKYQDRSISRISRRLSFFINDTSAMNEIIRWLNREIWTGEGVRAAGVSCCYLRKYDCKTKQMGLFRNSRDPLESIFKLDEKYGENIVFPANVLKLSTF